MEISDPVLLYIRSKLEILTGNPEILWDFRKYHFRNVTKKVFGEFWGITGNFPKKAESKPFPGLSRQNG